MNMYAIAFDLDQNILSETYPNDSYTNAYNDIKRVLRDFGFVTQQKSVYFGNGVDAVGCVLAVQALARKYAWFVPSIKDIRMLRIEDNNDLRPAIANIKPDIKPLHKGKSKKGKHRS